MCINKGLLSLEFLFFLLLLLIIISFFIVVNLSFVKRLEENERQEEYLEKIKQIKKNVLEKVNGVFFEKPERTNFYF